MDRVASMFKAIDESNRKETSYTMYVDEIMALYDLVDADGKNGLINAIIAAFDYGFVKGRRCEKAQQKKARMA